MLKLRSIDGVIVEVEKSVAAVSVVLRQIVEEKDFDHEKPLPIPSLCRNILDKVIQYCRKHVDSEDPTAKAWDAEFLTENNSILLDLVNAANYLDIESLKSLICMDVAKSIKGVTAEEIREKLNIKKDFTPEEEEEVKKENTWILK